MMNFSGQVGRPRQVNMGGRNKSTLSRQSVLQKAKEEREKRDKARKEEQAAIVLQSYFRGRLELRAVANEMSKTWDEEYLNSSSSDGYDVDTMLRMYIYITRVKRTSSADRLDKVCEAVAKHQPSEPVLQRLIPTVELLMNDQEMFLKVVDILVLAPQYSGREAFLKVVDKVAEFDLWSAVEVMAPHHPSEFVANFLTMPDIFKQVDPQKVLFKQGVYNFKENWVTINVDKIDICLDNIIFLVELGMQGGSSSQNLTSDLVAALAKVLNCVPVEYDGETEYVDDSHLEKVEKLCNREFIKVLFELLERDSGALDAISHVVVRLMELNPSKQRDLNMYLMVSAKSPVRSFWAAFKDSATYAQFSENICDNATTVTLLRDDIDPLRKLHVVLELYSFWMVVTNDAEFLANSNDQGLNLHGTLELTKFLKNLIYSIMQAGESLPNIAIVKSIKSLGISVLRQVYIRDSRRQFFDKGFWIMCNQFNVSRAHFLDVLHDDNDLKDPESQIIQHTPFFIPFNTRIMLFVDVVRVEANDRWYDRSRYDSSRSIPRPLLPPFNIWEMMARNRSAHERLRARNEIDMQHQMRPHFELPPGIDIPESEQRDDDGDVIIPQHGEDDEHERAYDESEDEEEYRQRYGSHRRNEAIRRGHEFDDAYRLYRNSNLRHRLSVEFISEHGEIEAGIDGGGLTKEFLNSVSVKGFDLNRGLFVESHDHLLFPNPEISSWDETKKTEALNQIEFLGKIIGKSLYDGILVDFEFAPFFLQKCQGRGLRNSFDDLWRFDPEIYNSLVKLHDFDGDVSELGINFMIGNTELCPDGKNVLVTNANRLQYIHAVANHKLNVELEPQTTAFFKGISKVIRPRLLAMFNADELQSLISGSTQSIDLDDLKQNVVYSRYSAEKQTIVDLWSILEEFTSEERGLFVKFVTSVPKAPLGGFRMLDPRFAILNAGEDIERLPTASTCANLLKLPDYRNKKLLKEKLLYSIKSRAGFDLS